VPETDPKPAAKRYPKPTARKRPEPDVSRITRAAPFVWLVDGKHRFTSYDEAKRFVA
jgi:hypothetical protein